MNPLPVPVGWLYVYDQEGQEVLSHELGHQNSSVVAVDFDGSDSKSFVMMMLTDCMYTIQIQY